MNNYIAKLESKYRNTNYALELYRDYLVRSWSKGKECGDKRIALDNLSPAVSNTTTRIEYSKATVVSGIVLAALSGVIYYSEIQRYVPLFSVFLMILSIWILIKGLRNYRMQTWTIFHEKSGEYFAHVIHEGCDLSRLKEFVRIFEEHMSERNKATNHGLESTSAPPAAGTLETHP